MIQFFGSNIPCFEYLKSCPSNILRCQSCTRELFYYQWSGFHHTLLLVQITLKPKKELNKFQFFLHKMTRQSLKLGKLMTDQVANTIGHVQWLNILTPAILYKWRGVCRGCMENDVCRLFAFTGRTVAWSIFIMS